MFLSESTVKKLDGLFDTSSQPYRILVNGTPTDTDCIAWHIPELNLTREQAETISDAMQKIKDQMRQENIEPLSLTSTQSDIAKFIKEYSTKSKALFLKEYSHLDKVVIQAALRILENPFKPGKAIPKRGRLLTRAREILGDMPVTAYKSGLTWSDTLTETSFDYVVVAPTVNQFDILSIEQTAGNNHELSTDEIIDNLKKIGESFGIDITGASYAVVEFKLMRCPKGREARQLGESLFHLAPDIYEVPRSFAKRLIALWWD